MSKRARNLFKDFENVPGVRIAILVNHKQILRPAGERRKRLVKAPATARRQR